MTFREVLIFVHENLPEEILLGLFQSTFLYLQIVSSFTKPEFMELVETLPPQYEQKAKSTYEQILEEGIEKGIEKLLLASLKKNPDWPDQRVADYFDVPASTVKKVRLSMSGNYSTSASGKSEVFL